MFRYCLFCVLVLGALCLPAPARALEVQDVRFGLYQDKTRLVMDLDTVSDFRVFALDNPYRLIVDLPDFRWRAGRVNKPKNAGITAMRHGRLKSGISRVVFETGRPMRVQSAFALPPKEGKPARLVVDFSSVPAQVFQETKKTVFGSLLEKGTPVLQGQKETPERPAQTALEKPLIVIDPGHGGQDPGALGAGLREKDVVLGLARALKAELEDSGQYRVIMTRSTDVFIKLADRVKFARRHKGDLFVSIHADSMPNADTHGASVYTLSETASDAQTEKLAARENKADLIAGIDLSVEDQEVANILVDLAMRDTMNQSKFFAGKLVSTLPYDGIDLLERPHRSAGFAVLKGPDIPSVLIESGFMSNTQEARRLNTRAHQIRFARALHKGIDAYFEQVRKNQRI